MRLPCRVIPCAVRVLLTRDRGAHSLTEDMLTKDEVEGLLEALLVDVKVSLSVVVLPFCRSALAMIHITLLALSITCQDTYRKELDRTAKISALVVEQMLASGTAAGVELTVDMGRAEDATALARVGTAASAAMAEEHMKRGAAVRLVRVSRSLSLSLSLSLSFCVCVCVSVSLSLSLCAFAGVRLFM